MYYADVDSPAGRIHMLATESGLAGLYFDRQREEMERRFPLDTRKPGRGNLWLLRAEALTYCYFAGDLDFCPEIPFALQGTAFQRSVWETLRTIPPASTVQGTAFQRSVWETLRTIPPASTVSYGEVAKQVGNPTASRAVGAAVGQNPMALIIPCHRVVGSAGGLTGYAGGLEVKRFLLEHEKNYARRDSTQPLAAAETLLS